MATELALGLNGFGDISLTATGDWVVLVDTADNPAASQQLLAHIVMTSPMGFDDYGNPVGRPDDLFNPWYGAGLRYALGKPLTPALTGWIQSNILQAIAANPNFVTTPTPIVTPYVDGTGDGQILLFIQVVTSLGYIAVLPAQPLSYF